MRIKDFFQKHKKNFPTFERYCIYHMTYLKCCSDYLIANREAVRWEVIGPEVKGHNIRENAHHGLITEWIDAADVKMA